jgi:hypothetical protein
VISAAIVPKGKALDGFGHRTGGRGSSVVDWAPKRSGNGVLYRLRRFIDLRRIAIHPGLPGNCALPSSITTQGCFSEHHMCTPGFTQDGSSKVPALMKVKPE